MKCLSVVKVCVTLALLPLLLIVFSSASLAQQRPNERVSYEPLCRSIGTEWVWFADYGAASIDFAVGVSDGHKVRAATGVSFFGNPAGSRYEFESGKILTGYGLGALHIKQIAGVGNAHVCVSQEGITNIPLSIGAMKALANGEIPFVKEIKEGIENLGNSGQSDPDGDAAKETLEFIEELDITIVEEASTEKVTRGMSED